jgi:hypothetical protein
MLAGAALDNVERRRHPRLSVAMPATYRSRRFTAGTCVVDLSQTGARLTSRVVEDSGTSAEILLQVPRRAAPVCLPGRVVWAHTGEGDTNSAAMGIVFTGARREDLLALANFLIVRSCCM